MYAPGPSDEELKAIGITREDIHDTSETEIWPENQQVFDVFKRLGTQWVIGQFGPTGLNYSSVETLMRVMGIQKKRQLRLFDEIRVMESEALHQMNRK